MRLLLRLLWIVGSVMLMIVEFRFVMNEFMIVASRVSCFCLGFIRLLVFARVGWLWLWRVVVWFLVVWCCLL